ncbi:MAG TPA: HEAT repeat domain-containing protein [Planctomycetota bacterium]|nr:HEAT repeat domain-containing protein [Planctomycetota bacterium]
MRFTLVAAIVCCTVLITAAEEGKADAPPPVPTPPVAPTQESPFPKLFEGLNAPDAEARVLSAKALLVELAAQIKDSEKPYLKSIADRISAEKPEDRSAAATEFKTAFDDTVKYNKEVVAGLQKALAGVDEAARTEAKKSLVTLMNLVIENKIVEKLIEELANPDPKISAPAAEKLKAMGEDAAFHLVQALEDERIGLRRLAADILKALGPKAKGSASDLAFLLDNDDKNVRRNAAAVLENLGPDAADATDDFVNYLSHDEKSVRRMAANILKKIGPKAAESTGDLVELLTDDDKNIRALSTEVLLTFGPAAKEGVDNLVLILEDEEGDDDSKDRAIRVLTAIGGAAKPALAEIKRLANEGKSDALRAAATEAAAKIEAAPEPPAEPKEGEKPAAQPEQKKDAAAKVEGAAAVPAPAQ